MSIVQCKYQRKIADIYIIKNYYSGHVLIYYYSIFNIVL